jgi:hypothetical protein
VDEVSRRPNLGRKIFDHRTGNLMVSFRYAPHFVEKVKSIYGHKWNPEGKYWSFANATGILERASKVCKGERISIDPRLQPLCSSHCDAKPRKSQGVKCIPEGNDNASAALNWTHIPDS